MCAFYAHAWLWSSVSRIRTALVAGRPADRGHTYRHLGLYLRLLGLHLRSQRPRTWCTDLEPARSAGGRGRVPSMTKPAGRRRACRCSGRARPPPGPAPRPGSARTRSLPDRPATLGLAGKRDEYFRSLPGGQKQRLSIALALIGHDRVLGTHRGGSGYVIDFAELAWG